jgi:hypothetical protein
MLLSVSPLRKEKGRILNIKYSDGDRGLNDEGERLKAKGAGPKANGLRRKGIS